MHPIGTCVALYPFDGMFSEQLTQKYKLSGIRMQLKILVLIYLSPWHFFTVYYLLLLLFLYVLIRVTVSESYCKFAVRYSQGRPPPTAVMQPFPPSLLCSLPFSSLSPPLPLSWGPGGSKHFEIKDAHRLVLEHFRHKNQHIYEPDFWL